MSQLPQYSSYLMKDAKHILMRSNVFEVVWSAIFLRQERLAIVELAGSAAGALGRVGAVEVRCMPVSNVTEPKQEHIN